MATFYVKSGAGALALSNRTWSVGEKMVPARSDSSSNASTAKKWVWECTTGGTSTGTPTWSASVTQDVTTVTQNGVVWTARKPGFSSGTTANWAFATIYLDYGVNAATGGDTVYVSDGHDETISDMSVGHSGATKAAPIKIICADDSVAPPTASATTAIVRNTTGHGYITGSLYVYGITFKHGNSSNGGYILYLSHQSYILRQHFVKCTFENISTQSLGNWFQVGTTEACSGRVFFDECNLIIPSGGNQLNSRVQIMAECEWRGGAFTYSGGGTYPATAIFYCINSNGTNLLFTGIDFSAWTGNSTDFFEPINQFREHCVLRDCKLWSGWTGDLATTTSLPAAGRFSMYNCDNADTNYRLMILDPYGLITDETTIVRTGGATDGTTPIAWKMAANSSANDANGFLYSDEIVVWNETVGSSVTATVEILHDSATNLKENEVWLEITYLGATDRPLASRVTDDVRGANSQNVLATPADQADSSETWTTTGLTNPNTQKVSASFTPQCIGPVHVRVAVAKASKTVYVDPTVTLS